MPVCLCALVYVSVFSVVILLTHTLSCNEAQPGMAVYGYNADGMWFAIGMVVCIGLGWELAALLALKLTQREKHK